MIFLAFQSFPQDDENPQDSINEKWMTILKG